MERAVNAARGTLLGLACGDALGRPVEFSTSAGIEREHGTLTKMAGDGTHGQPAGTITDDTELALRIGRSLADRSEFDGGDIARRFVEWYRSGPFDIGLMTADALRAIDDGMSWREAGQVVWESRSEGSNAGNGSLMRCAPYAIRYARSPIELDAVSRNSSAITHADPRCTHACSVLNRILATLMLVDEETARELPFDPLVGVVENPLFGLPDDIEVDVYDLVRDFTNVGLTPYTECFSNAVEKQKFKAEFQTAAKRVAEDIPSSVFLVQASPDT